VTNKNHQLSCHLLKRKKINFVVGLETYVVTISTGLPLSSATHTHTIVVLSSPDFEFPARKSRGKRCIPKPMLCGLSHECSENQRCELKICSSSHECETATERETQVPFCSYLQNFGGRRTSNVGRVSSLR
jgi:hypothetical protein